MAGLPPDVGQQQIVHQQIVQQRQPFEVVTTEAVVAEPVIQVQTPQPQVMRRFDPEDHELHKDFRLTRYTELKG